MKIALADNRRARLVGHLQKLFKAEFDETLSDYRAGQVIDLMLKTLGPAVYNQAVQDVRAHMQAKLDDLEGEVFIDGDI
ncbi:MAG TPA: DUF2164 domain-containing protein [Hyphomonadaceae bacterium]|nr:DUF2164 domain-containing protein [Hyphomonadaceae bacterium]